MGEVQDCVGKNGKGNDGSPGGAKPRNNKDEKNEVARGVIERLQSGEPGGGREEGATKPPDEELDVPNLEVPDNR